MNHRISQALYVGYFRRLFLTLICFCVLTVSQVAYSYSTPVGLSLSFGTLGTGASVTYNIENRLGVRIGANSYDFDRKITADGADFDAAIEISGLSSRFDWYPWAAKTRVTAGLISNTSKAVAMPSESNLTMEVNKKEISLNDAGVTEVEVNFLPVAAYFGVGWGNAGRGGGLSLFADLGVVLQSAPDVSLEIENQAAVGLTKGDIKAQERSYERDLKPLRFYPVFTVGVSYNL